VSNHSYSINNSNHGYAGNSSSVTSKPLPSGSLRRPPAPPVASAASAHPMRLVQGSGGQMIEIPKIMDPSLNEEDEDEDEEEIQQLEDDDSSSDQDIRGIREFVATSTRNLQVVPLSDHHPPPLRKTFSWVASASFRIRNNTNKNVSNDDPRNHPLQIPELCSSSSSSASSASSSDHSATSRNSMALSSASTETSHHPLNVPASPPSSIASSCISVEDQLSAIDDDQHHSDDETPDQGQNN
jgi:hypothetical protein